MGFCEGDAEVLAKELKVNKTLKKLSLADNKIVINCNEWFHDGSPVLDPIFRALSENGVLTHLDLSSNCLNPDNVVSLQSELYGDIPCRTPLVPTLISLTLDHNNLTLAQDFSIPRPRPCEGRGHPRHRPVDYKGYDTGALQALGFMLGHNHGEGSSLEYLSLKCTGIGGVKYVYARQDITDGFHDFCTAVQKSSLTYLGDAAYNFK